MRINRIVLAESLKGKKILAWGLDEIPDNPLYAKDDMWGFKDHIGEYYYETYWLSPDKKLSGMVVSTDREVYFEKTIRALKEKIRVLRKGSHKH